MVAGFHSTVAEAERNGRGLGPEPRNFILAFFDEICNAGVAEVQKRNEIYDNSFLVKVLAFMRLGRAIGGPPSRWGSTRTGCSKIQCDHDDGAFPLRTFAEGDAPQSLNPTGIVGFQNTAYQCGARFSDYSTGQDEAEGFLLTH